LCTHAGNAFQHTRDRYLLRLGLGERFIYSRQLRTIQLVVLTRTLPIRHGQHDNQEHKKHHGAEQQPEFSAIPTQGNRPVRQEVDRNEAVRR